MAATAVVVCFCVELVKLLVYRYSGDIFSYLVLREYWVLKESRIPFKPVLGGVRIDAAVFLYCWSSLFLNDPLFRIIYPVIVDLQKGRMPILL